MKIKTFHGINGPYLTIYRICRVARLSACVHNFHRGDEDRDCHDHPFAFLSIVLRGSYREHLFDGRSIDRGVGSIRFRSSRYRHRIELLRKPCLTLCLKWAVRREWGFWNNDEFIPWRDYLRSKGLTPLED